MARTPWLQASSLPSERLKPKPAPASQGGGKSKTKAKNKDTGPPKSAAIRKLEAMIADLETTMPGGGGDASAGVAAKGKARENACFCQGAPTCCIVLAIMAKKNLFGISACTFSVVIHTPLYLLWPNPLSLHATAHSLSTLLFAPPLTPSTSRPPLSSAQ